jgi:hypothetical protein
MAYAAYVHRVFTWKETDDSDQEPSYRDNRTALSAPISSTPSSRDYPDFVVRLSNSISAASLASSSSNGSDESPDGERQPIKKREVLKGLEAQSSTVRAYPGVN